MSEMVKFLIEKKLIHVIKINFLLQAIVGPLPAGFLRLNTEREIQESADRQAAMALYQQQNATYVVSRMLVQNFTKF